MSEITRSLPLRLCCAVFLVGASCRSSSPGPSADGRLDSVARRYVVLGLSLGRHDANYVDAYYGPDSLREASERDSLSVAEVRAGAESLIAVLDQGGATYDDSLVAMRHRYRPATPRPTSTRCSVGSTACCPAPGRWPSATRASATG